MWGETAAHDTCVVGEERAKTYLEESATPGSGVEESVKALIRLSASLPHPPTGPMLDFFLSPGGCTHSYGLG